jgi:hypothetical protein
MSGEIAALEAEVKEYKLQASSISLHLYCTVLTFLLTARDGPTWIISRPGQPRAEQPEI